MAEPRLSRRMSAQDASFLYFEKPDAPLHIGSVAIYDGTIDFERAYTSINARMHTIPRYRQRTLIPPFYAGHPTWEDDPGFSLDRHLTLLELQPGTSMEQLSEISSAIFEEPLPRDRPLWAMTLITGLQGDRSAIVSRVHHCLVDGVSGIELLLAVLDLVPNPEPTPQPAEPWEPKTAPNPMESWGEAVFESWAAGVRNFAEAQQNLLDPRAQFRSMTSFARAVEIALPTAFRRAAPTPWNKPIGGKRRAAWTEMNFQEVRCIRSRLGGTVNDVVLTVLGGGLGRYLQGKGVNTDGMKLRFMIPVNVRSESELGALGNRVSMMLPDIPVGIANPADRLVAVRGEMERLKAQEQGNAFESFSRASANLPAVVHALAGMAGIPGGAINLVCTNVPGPLIPLYCVGHRMLAHYPMVPLAADLGIGVGITSYDKDLFMGIMSDSDLVGDVETIRDYISAEFKLLRTLADVPVSDLPTFNGTSSRNGHTDVPSELSKPKEPATAAAAATTG